MAQDANSTSWVGDQKYNSSGLECGQLFRTQVRLELIRTLFEAAIIQV
jgi:hypothetical protein